MNDIFKEHLGNIINDNKSTLANPGTRPLVSHIKQRALDIKTFVEDPPYPMSTWGGNSDGYEIFETLSGRLISIHFKGWKEEDFDRLIVELNNL